MLFLFLHHTYFLIFCTSSLCALCNLSPPLLLSSYATPASLYPSIYVLTIISASVSAYAPPPLLFLPMYHTTPHTTTPIASLPLCPYPLSHPSSTSTLFTVPHFSTPLHYPPSSYFLLWVWYCLIFLALCMTPYPLLSLKRDYFHKYRRR